MEEKHGSKKKDLEELMREGRVEAMLSKVYQQMVSSNIVSLSNGIAY